MARARLSGRMTIVEQLAEMVEGLNAAVGLGRLDFDHAIREYVETSDSQLAESFRVYVEALSLGPASVRDPGLGESYGSRDAQVRKAILQRIAKRHQVPELTRFVQAIIFAQEHQDEMAETLDTQARLLRFSTGR